MLPTLRTTGQGGGGVDKVSRKQFLLFVYNFDFSAFGSKKSFLSAKLAFFKDTIFLRASSH